MLVPLIGDAQDAISPLWTTILGAVLALTGGIIVQWRQERREHKSIRFALASEIRAILTSFRGSQYEEMIRQNITFIETHPHMRRVTFSHFQTTYNTVFASCGSRLGVLPSRLVSDVVTYYYSVQEFIEQITLLDKARLDINIQLNRENTLAVFRGLLFSLTTILGSGPDLIDRLEQPSENSLL